MGSPVATVTERSRGRAQGRHAISDGPRAIALSLSEKQFTEMVVDRARWQGWLVFHPLAARTSKGWRTAGQGTPQGFPDLTLAKDGRVLFVELKSERGRLTEAQKTWLEALGGHVWRPSDWQKITAVLDERN